MLSKLRHFSKSKFAGILVGIIIIPFVFWGMGGVFTTGNKNNVAKINDHSISTQDFFNYLNNSQLDKDYIKFLHYNKSHQHINIFQIHVSYHL